MSDPTTPIFAEIFADDLFAPGAPAEELTLDPAHVFAEADAEPVGTRTDDGRRIPRFDGDTSRLAAEVCWALQQLVAAPHIGEESHSWPVVLDNEAVLRSRLSELGLLLVVNREHRYAYARQGEDASRHSRTILRTRTLSLAASALALHLYQHYITAADDPIVERGDMEDHMLASYRPAEDTDEVAFKKRINAAIGQLGDVHILKPVAGNTDRFTVSPAITAIVTAEQVTALQQRYQDLTGSAIGTDESRTEGDGSPA
jgi:hypothetical protein